MARDNPPGQPSVIASSGVTIQSDPVGGTAANTVIDATDVGVGLVIWFDGATIKNLTIRNAYRNGIVAEDVAELQTTGVTVSGNVVTGNKCKDHPTAIFCRAPDPGTEYGAGIAFHGIDTSSIRNNTVTDNFAGILVRNHWNVSSASASISVEHNTVNDNLDSGIVFRSTDPLAVTDGSRGFRRFDSREHRERQRWGRDPGDRVDPRRPRRDRLHRAQCSERQRRPRDHRQPRVRHRRTQRPGKYRAPQRAARWPGW